METAVPGFTVVVELVAVPHDSVAPLEAYRSLKAYGLPEVIHSLELLCEQECRQAQVSRLAQVST